MDNLTQHTDTLVWYLEKSLKHDYIFVTVLLTWTVPLWAALVSINQYGKAKQATVWRVGSEGAALGFVEQDKLVVDTDVLCALINDLCIWRLDGKK